MCIARYEWLKTQMQNNLRHSSHTYQLSCQVTQTYLSVTFPLKVLTTLYIFGAQQQTIISSSPLRQARPHSYIELLCNSMIAILINMPIETMGTRDVRPNVYTCGAAMLRIRRACVPMTCGIRRIWHDIACAKNEKKPQAEQLRPNFHSKTEGETQKRV